MSFIWKDKKIEFVKDTLEAMYGCESKEEAQALKAAYAAEHGQEKAEEDLGFLTGEMNDEDRHRAYDWFDVSHPVLGRADLTPQEILDAGKRFAWGSSAN